ncbi:flagellin [Lachnospiraceae bacterium C1.1]|nr:flagellin [Lachnospiraceae bacterium C1.1]
MSTRVTNKMMTNNARYHINQNKAYLDKLSIQESSEKKINSPSDDPVIAVRSLRFRSALADINQYLEKNLSDAKSWVDSTETALDSARDLMTSLKKEATSGANDTNSIAACRTYYDEMKALVDGFYDLGNSTNEDRYLFTGYRTSDSLTISEEDLDLRNTQVASGNPKYDYVIREEFTADDINNYTFLTASVSSSDVTVAATGSGTATVDDETDIGLIDCYRIRLSYDNLTSGGSTTTVESWLTPKTIELCNADGSYDSTTYAVTEITDDTSITEANLDAGTIYFNTTTGMLIFGSDIRAAMATASDNADALNRTGSDLSGIRFTYEKDEWETGDLKPEHYFDCVDTALDDNLVYDDHEQEMNYSVGANQQIQVNINAGQAFDPQVRRYIDELSDAIDAAESAETMVAKIKEAMTTVDEDSTEYENLNYLLAAAQKELSSTTDKMKSLFENGMTEIDGFYDEVNLAATECGTTQNRVSIIETRLTENQATVKTQASDNENIDIADIAVELSDANMIYEAALLVTGKINQQSLLNYI